MRSRYRTPERLSLARAGRGPHDGSVKGPSIAALTVALLASATVLEGVAYAQKADACWFQRLPQSARPDCCDLVGKTRFTPEGGDCCKLFRWEEGEPRASSDASPDVLPAMLVATLRVAAPQIRARGIDRPVPSSRAPPWRPTDTVRLLI